MAVDEFGAAGAVAGAGFVLSWAWAAGAASASSAIIGRASKSFAHLRKEFMEVGVIM